MAKFQRGIKNLVHNYSEAEIKVREATSNDPGGPIASQMSELAEYTFQDDAYYSLMEMLWKRLNDQGKWRHVYKSLVVVEYLIKNGSENVVNYCEKNMSSLENCTNFYFIEKDGKDHGVLVREKAENVLTLLKDKTEKKETEKNPMVQQEQMTYPPPVNTGYSGGPQYLPQGYPPGGTYPPSQDIVYPPMQNPPVGIGDQGQYPGYPLHQPPDATQYPQPTLGGYPTQQPLDTTQFIGYPPSNTGQYYPPPGGYPPQQVEYSQTSSDYKLDGYPIPTPAPQQDTVFSSTEETGTGDPNVQPVVDKVHTPIDTTSSVPEVVIVDDTDKEDVQDDIQTLFAAAGNTKGLAIIVGSSKPSEFQKNIRKIRTTFKSEMKFPVLFKSDSTCEEIATIVQAAAEYKEYPTSCEFIIFYFVGNGIVDEDGQPFLYDKADNKLSVHKHVVAPFFPESSPVLGGRARLFFFDCCLSRQFEDIPQPKKKDVTLPSYENCLFVYNGYEKATGQWTPFFNENVKEKLSIFDIVSKTCGDIKNQNSEEFHEPYIFSSISPVFINGQPDAQVQPQPPPPIESPEIQPIVQEPVESLVEPLPTEQQAFPLTPDIPVAPIEIQPIVQEPEHKLVEPLPTEKQAFPLIPDIPVAPIEIQPIVQEPEHKLVEPLPTEKQAFPLTPDIPVAPIEIQPIVQEPEHKLVEPLPTEKQAFPLIPDIPVAPIEIQPIVQEAKHQPSSLETSPPAPKQDIPDIPLTNNTNDCLSVCVEDLVSKKCSVGSSWIPKVSYNKLMEWQVFNSSDLQTVLEETIEVTCWEEVGSTLGIPSYKLERIAEENNKVLARQREMYKAWIDSGKATWKALCDALRNVLVNQSIVADKIEKKYLEINKVQKQSEDNLNQNSKIQPQESPELFLPQTVQERDVQVSQQAVDQEPLSVEKCVKDSQETSSDSSKPPPPPPEPQIQQTAGIGATGGGSIMDKSPERLELFKLLKSKSNSWDEFARELRVERSFRVSLRSNTALSNDKRLEEVLQRWIDSESSPVTWKRVIHVLDELKLKRVVKDVKKYLQRPDVIEKYSEMEDYES